MLPRLPPETKAAVDDGSTGAELLKGFERDPASGATPRLPLAARNRRPIATTAAASAGSTPRWGEIAGNIVVGDKVAAPSSTATMDCLERQAFGRGAPSQGVWREGRT